MLRSESPPSDSCQLVSTVLINDLPDEMILKVFSYLSVEDLCCAASFVCLRWRMLSHDPLLWRKCKFCCDENVSSQYATYVLSNVPMLDMLRIESHDADEILSAAFEGCQRIQKLVIRFCKSITANLVQRLVNRYPNITLLNLEGSELVDVECFEAISQFVHLTELNVSHCKVLDGNLLRKIVCKCKFLEALNIDGIVHIDDSDIMYLVEEMKDTLLNLKLDGENLTDAAFGKLEDCRKLQILGISFCDQMTDKSLESIGKLQLMYLKLRRGVKLTSVALALFLAQQNLRDLIHLDLSECSNLDDRGAVSISLNCPLLQFLALRWCWDITEDGLEFIIKRCQFLQVLDLLGVVRITGACFKLIPGHLTSLEMLNLEQCTNVVDEVLIDLAKVLPALIVTNYYGDAVTADD